MTLKQRFVDATHREGVAYDLVYYLGLSIKKHIYLLRFGHLLRRRAIRHYLDAHPIRRLHLGAGSKRIDGFLNSDLFGHVPIDITKRLPLPSLSCDLVVSNHVVEHIYQRQFRHFLVEAYRVLKAGGIMIIGTPSFEKMARAMYCDGNESVRRKMLDHIQKKVGRSETVTPASYLNDNTHRLFQHKYIYDLETMRTYGREAGFRSVESVSLEAIADSGIRQALPAPGSHRDLQSETFVFTK
jgi:predicted SAM-dependent methyltransferase